MKLLADFFPVILFFVAYQLFDIYIATAVAVLASIVQVGYHWLSKKRVETPHLVTLAILLVFGGLTLLLQDRTFIMWKPTVVNWLFGMVLLGSQFIGRQPILQRLQGGQLELPNRIWRQLNLAWALFFLALGFLNLYVANDFFVAEAQLMTLTGMQQIDFNNCGGLFSGNQLEMCNTAHSLEQGWVNFKLFGMMGLILVFSLLQAFYLARYLPGREAAKEEN
ncbi:MAG: septation protein A [Chromatiales bacterium]|jgi:intracellular septation protein